MNAKLIAQLVVSIVVIVGFYTFVFALFFFARSIDPGMKDVVIQISGALIAAFGGVIGFWIGTSLSSSAKDQTISNLTKPA